MHTIRVKRTSQQLLTDVQQILRSSMGDYPDLNMLADAFHVSPRTLRRQLAAAGTCYQKELNRIRCEWAIEYLLITQMPPEEIAEHLGFSDVTNFRHAFKKWTGLGPSTYREQYCHNQLSWAS